MEVAVKKKKRSNKSVSVAKSLSKHSAMSFFVSVLEFFVGFLMIFGGILPYVPQYKTILRTKDNKGFSTYVCLTLLISNIFRILFWFGRRFDLILLAQSAMMILTMMLMLHLCVTTRNINMSYINGKGNVPVRQLSDLILKDFWDWTEYSSYMAFLMTVLAVSSTLMYFLMENRLFVEIVGAIALLGEAMLATPQLVKNYNTNSTAGLNIWMVVGWAVGDVFKTAFFIIRKSPMQFFVCGFLQVVIDVLIFAQFIFYNRMSDISLFDL